MTWQRAAILFFHTWASAIELGQPTHHALEASPGSPCSLGEEEKKGYAAVRDRTLNLRCSPKRHVQPTYIMVLKKYDLFSYSIVPPRFLILHLTNLYTSMI